jgi:hypothetical protein
MLITRTPGSRSAPLSLPQRWPGPKGPKQLRRGIGASADALALIRRQLRGRQNEDSPRAFAACQFHRGVRILIVPTLPVVETVGLLFTRRKCSMISMGLTGHPFRQSRQKS